MLAFCVFHVQKGFQTSHPFFKSRQCSRAFLMVSGTLRSEGKGAVDEIAAALGEICVGVWHGMPAHTPRDAVLNAAAEVS